MQQRDQRQKMAIMPLLAVLLAVAAAVADATPALPRGDSEQPADSLPAAADEEQVPAAPAASTTETPTNLTIYQDQSFQLHRDLAIQLVLGKVLRALGPKYKERLPTAPTNATLTDINSTLNMETHSCPSYYTRCSSQTFYPSCDLPSNTDELMWNQRFTLFFDISADIANIHRDNLLGATLRLYKNLSLPLDNPRTLIIKLHAFTRSLRRNREHSITVTNTRVASDYVGWVLMDVARLVRRLKGRSNYGVKISVQNENNVPWNIPDLFVKMDCGEAYNETLIPLPFEVPLDENAKKYPAFNIRSGTEETSSDSEDYQDYYGEHQNRPQSASRNSHHYNNGNGNKNRRYRQQGGLRRHRGDNHGRNNINNMNNNNQQQQHYNGNHPNLNQRQSLHFYDSEDNDGGMERANGQGLDHSSSLPTGEEVDNTDQRYDSHDSHYDQHQYPSGDYSSSSSGGSYNEQYHQGHGANRHQPRYKKQSPVFSSSSHHNSNSQYHSPSQQQYEERPYYSQESFNNDYRPTYSQENQNTDYRPSYSQENQNPDYRLSYSQENQNPDYRPSYSQENQNSDYRPFYSQENQNGGNRPVSRDYQSGHHRYSSQEDVTSSSYHRRPSHRQNAESTSRHGPHHNNPRRYHSRENYISDDARLISDEAPNSHGGVVNDAAEYDSALDEGSSSSHTYNTDHSGSDYNGNFDYYPDYNSDRHHQSHRQIGGMDSHRSQHNRHNGGHRHHGRQSFRRRGGSGRRHRQHHQRQRPLRPQTTELPPAPAVYDEAEISQSHAVLDTGSPAENKIQGSDSEQAT